MRDLSSNHYERAFENWLRDNRIEYLRADEHKKSEQVGGPVKSFDFLLSPPNQLKIIAEVKGRKFKGTSFEKLTGFECWVTREDIDGLTSWQKNFGPDYVPVFVFAYRIENVDVDFDGRAVYDFDRGKYVFFAVKLSDYRKHMKRRSPKWQTVTLPAEKFRKCARQLQELLV
jgi:hypothetical protein